MEKKRLVKLLAVLLVNNVLIVKVMDIKFECPTYLRSRGKAMAVTLSDDEGSDHDFDSD